jgi:heat-inducible transcriptional repressor
MEKRAELDERSTSVLNAIIDCYIKRPDPVGSRTLSRNFNFRLSPSSIRNVMSDLEDLGFIIQPYASAGRVPTDKGYRYFVDHLEKPTHLAQPDLNTIQKFRLEQGSSLEDLLAQTSNLLSDLSHQAGVAVISKLDSATLKRIQFIKLSEGRVLVVCVLGSDLIRQKVIHLEEESPQNELDRITNFFNSNFVGFTLSGIRKELLIQMKDEKKRFDELHSRAMKFSEMIVEDEIQDGKIYLGPTSNIFDLPEFQEDVRKMKQIFQAFEEKTRLVGILDKCLEENVVTIIIGSELFNRNMQDCSVVARTYADHDRILGTLGIIGSKRMDYQRSIALVEFMAARISRILSGENSGPLR